jgi:LPXTG-motif cell wall-anchored protein
MLRVAIAGAVAAAALVLLAPAASAQYSNVAAVSVANSSDTCVPGHTITATAVGFAFFTTVTFRFNGQVIGTAQTDGEGNATLTVPYPDGVDPGTYQLTATGLSAVDNETVTVTADIECLAPTTTAASPLPRTGSNSTGVLFRVGVVLVAAGGLLTLSARRRRAPRAAGS